MLTNYLKIAFRNLMKNKLFSIINIIGMTISLASCFLIALFVWDEWKYDDHHPDGDRTFRVYNIRQGDDGVTNYYPIVPIPFATYMQQDFPEIESTFRMMDTFGEKLFEINDQKILEANGAYAEPLAFDMLDIQVISGSSTDALQKPNTIALSKTLAQKYFGEKNALGETIKIGKENFQVSAVFSDMSKHFHLRINYLISFATLTKSWKQDRFENWQFQQFFTYLKLKPGTDAKALESKFPAFVEKYAYPQIKSKGFTYVPHLQNIKDIYLNSTNFEWDISKHGNAQAVHILSFTATLLLIIACLNFINLSTARSIKRMKEVGIRKVVGAHRHQLIAQFISESVLITMLGLLCALFICELTLPSLNAFAQKELVLPFTPIISFSVVFFCIAIGIIAGSYPAFHLSRFRPVAILYNKSSNTGNTAIFRQGLVVLQFMFSFFLITGSMIVLSQNDLLRNKDLGFSKEQLVLIPLRSAQLQHQTATKQEFLGHPNIISATIAFGIPSDIVAGDDIIEPVTNKTMPANLFCVDHDYIKTLKMQIIAGRDFSLDYPSDVKHGFIINETAARVYGFENSENAIGKSLHWKDWSNPDSLKKGTVIGVVKDFYFKSLREQVTPVVMVIEPDFTFKLALRIKPQDLSGTIAFLKKTYDRLDPEWPFTYQFVDQNFEAMYQSEEKLSTLFTIFTGLAIMVACLGLFGLVEYSVNQRTKEISIRKIFGASVNSLLLLLTRKYFLLVLIAFLVIIPISYVVAQQWLSNFAYHITLSPWMYGKACTLILLITGFTVSFQSLKAAWANPANSLRNE